MAIPTYATVISQINTYIVANGNNEITANILNPILKVITDFANNTIGDLATLTTSDQTNVVNAINSLKLAFDNLNNNGVQLLTGYDDPNVIPPPSFNYADFFMQLDVTMDLPLQLWQWNGTEWTSYSSVYSKAEIDFIVDTIYNAISVNGNISFLNIIPTATQTNFEIGSNVQVISVHINNGFIAPLIRWNVTGTTLTLSQITAEANDEVCFCLKSI